MKENIKSTLMRYTLMIVAVATLSFATSCGGDDDNGGDGVVTQGQKVLEAITGTYNVDTSGLPAGVQSLISSPSVTITTSTTGATWTADDVSGLSTYVIGGGFIVAADGTVSSANVNTAPGSNLAVSNVNVTASETQVVISFDVADSQIEAAARTTAIGTWTITVSIR